VVSNPQWIIGSLPGGDPGTRYGDYRWAAESATFREAADRWRIVLEKYPKDEDGLDYNMRRNAKMELMRAYYTVGRVEEGDAVMKELERNR
jgi:hypothetical protein